MHSAGASVATNGRAVAEPYLKPDMDLEMSSVAANVAAPYLQQKVRLIVLALQVSSAMSSFALR